MNEKEKWEIREELVKDERLRNILRIIKNNPGASRSRIVKITGYSPITVIKKIETLEKHGLIKIEGERKQASGKPNKHYITEEGALLLKNIEKIPRPSALVEVMFSNSFLKSLSERDAREVQRVFAEPSMKDAFGMILSRIMVFWAVELHKEPSYMCFFLDEYDGRFYFFGALSKEHSMMIRELLEKKVFSTPVKALDFMMMPGLGLITAIKDNLNDFLENKKAIVNFLPVRYNPLTKNPETIKEVNIKKLGKRRWLVEVPNN